MRKLTGLFFAAMVTLLSVGCQATSSLADGPFVQNVGKDQATVMWTSRQPVAAEVRFGADQLDRSAASYAVRRVEFKPLGKERDKDAPADQVEYVYEARLTGLTPGASYRYQVRSAGGSLGGGTIKAAPAKAEKFTFVAYGDSRTDHAQHARVAAAIRSADPAFIIHTGDLTDSGHYAQYRSHYFEPLKQVLASVPVYASLGNHEGDGMAFLRLFDLPNNERWYSFDYANAHFICLDSTAGKTSRAEMVAWLDKDLAASHADWKIVFYHYPSYDIATRHTAWGREDVLPLLRKYKVDLVLAGHSHGYQRMNPLRTPGENDAHPITHMVAAGGGASLHSMEQSPYAAVGIREYHHVEITIDGDTLTGRTVTPDGKLLDSFSLRKPGGKFEADYLKAAMDETRFDHLREQIVAHLRGIAVSELPAPGKPVDVTFPIGAGADAMKFKLFVDADGYKQTSASGSSPAGGTTDITLRIEPTVPVTTKGTALDPMVRLECHYQVGPYKGKCYGGVIRYRSATQPAGDEQE